jgi:hypothetical protein
MCRLLLGAFLMVAAAAVCAQAPDLGAGPHQSYQPMEGGNGDSLRPGSPEPKVPMPKEEEKAGTSGGKASTGSSAKPSDRQDREDERRATERKEKAKQRPGYKDEAPSPRAAIPSSRANGAGRVD